MSALVTAEIDGRALSEDEILGFCFLLVSGGNDTTMHLIATGSVLLAENPDARAGLSWRRIRSGCRMRSKKCSGSSLPRSCTRELRPAMSICTAPRFRQGAASCSSGVLRIATSASSSTRIPSTSNGRTRGISASVSARTSASERRWPAWKLACPFAGLLARWPEYVLSDSPVRLVSPWARGYVTVPIGW